MVGLVELPQPHGNTALWHFSCSGLIIRARGLGRRRATTNLLVAPAQVAKEFSHLILDEALNDLYVIGLYQEPLRHVVSAMDCSTGLHQMALSRK